MPEIYFGIRDNKDLFTDLMENVLNFDREKLQKDKLRCDEILSRSVLSHKNNILELLMRLFPHLRHIYEPGVAFYHSQTIARKNRRICSPDVFDIYFRLSMPTGYIPDAEFETILALASAEDIFTQALTRLNQDDKIIKFLNQLDSDVVNSIPVANIPHIIAALLDNGDLFPQGVNTPLSFNTPMRIHRIIHRLLRRIKTTEDRFNILKYAISKANLSLYIIVHELTEQAREHNESEDTYLPVEFRDITPDQLGTLQLLAIKHIEYWAKTDRLAEHPMLLAILYAWKQWSRNENFKEFVSTMVKSDRGLIAFLIAIFNEAIDQAIYKNEMNPQWENGLIMIENFIAAKSIENHAVALFEDQYFEKLREREQLALMIFLDQVKAKTTKIIPKTTA